MTDQVMKVDTTLWLPALQGSHTPSMHVQLLEGLLHTVYQDTLHWHAKMKHTVLMWSNKGREGSQIYRVHFLLVFSISGPGDGRASLRRRSSIVAHVLHCTMNMI